MTITATFTADEVRLALDVLARVAALGHAHADLLNAPAYSSLMRKFGQLYAQLVRSTGGAP